MLNVKILKKRTKAAEEPLPLIPSAPVEPLSSLVILGSSQERRVCDLVNVKQGDAETELCVLTAQSTLRG